MEGLEVWKWTVRRNKTFSRLGKALISPFRPTSTFANCPDKVFSTALSHTWPPSIGRWNRLFHYSWFMSQEPSTFTDRPYHIRSSFWNEPSSSLFDRRLSLIPPAQSGVQVELQADHCVQLHVTEHATPNERFSKLIPNSDLAIFDNFENPFLHCKAVLVFRSIIENWAVRRVRLGLVRPLLIHSFWFHRSFPNIYIVVDLVLVFRNQSPNMWLNKYPMVSNRPKLDMHLLHMLFPQFQYHCWFHSY